MHKKLLMLLFTVLLSGSMVYGSGFSIYEQGAKASAMGGAFIAMSNDVSAIFYNPAGMTSLKGLQLGMGATIIMPEFSFTGPTNVDPNLYTKAKKHIFPPAHFYITYGLTDRLTAGFGFYTMFGLGTDWPRDWPGRVLATKSFVETFSFNPVIAYKVLDNLSVAAGFTYMIGTVDLQKSIYTGYAADTYVESKLKASGTGYGFNVGVQYKPMEKLTIGAVYRHNILMKFNDGDATFEIPQLRNEKMYQYLRAAFPNTKGSSELNFPNEIGLGIAYAFTEQLTAEFDFMQLGWSSYDILKIKFKEPVAGQTESKAVKNYEDSYSLRFGLEYKVNEKLAIRAGYLRDNHAVPDEYVEPTLPESDRNLYSVGLGYKLNNITFDAYYMLLLQDDRTIKNSKLEVNGQPFPFNGTYKGMTNMFGMTIGISL